MCWLVFENSCKLKTKKNGIEIWITYKGIMKYRHTFVISCLSHFEFMQWVQFFTYSWYNHCIAFLESHVVCSSIVSEYVDVMELMSSWLWFYYRKPRFCLLLWPSNRNLIFSDFNNFSDADISYWFCFFLLSAWGINFIEIYHTFNLTLRVSWHVCTRGPTCQ